jgi:Holliday junction resolvase-like predicted endonuclease
LNEDFKKDWSFSYLRTKDNVEIDLIIERPGKPLALIEIKSTSQVQNDDVKALQKLGKDLQPAELFCLSRDLNSQKRGDVLCHHWKEEIQFLLQD